MAIKLSKCGWEARLLGWPRTQDVSDVSYRLCDSDEIKNDFPSNSHDLHSAIYSRLAVPKAYGRDC